MGWKRSGAAFLSAFSLFLMSALQPSVAHAQVRYSAADGFWSTHTVAIDAPRHIVFRSLTKEVSRWWNADHSYSGEARNFRLPAVAGGCFCERLAGGGSVEHMRVVFAQPGKELRLAGGLGPLQTLGVSGSMVIRLEEDLAAQTAPQKTPEKTVLKYSYRVSGAAAVQLDQLAEAVDAVQLNQLMRLKHWIEQRNPNWPSLNQR